MDRDKFILMLNELLDTYNPKTRFGFDDYYNQVKYLRDNDIPRLRARIIENCEYFPKPAELKKIADEFRPQKTVGDKPREVSYCFCGNIVHEDGNGLCLKHSDEKYDREHPGNDVIGDFRKATKMLKEKT